MPYAGFQPLCGCSSTAPSALARQPARALAQPAPAQPAAPPRRANWKSESGGVQVGAPDPRSGASELRRTYVDADEVAMDRAIARISGNDTARQTGNQYSQTNRSRITAQLAAKASQGLVPQDPHAQHLARKAKMANYTSITERGISVPRVGVRTMGPMPPPVLFVPHRQTYDEIAEAQHNFERPKAPPGVPTRSSDEKREELATRNAFFGKTPEEVLAEKDGAPRHGRRSGQGSAPAGGAAKSEEEELRAQIADEVAERQQFLDDMRTLGKANEYEAQINAQIAERLDDLKRLDKLG